jgi:hypothetical protein
MNRIKAGMDFDLHEMREKKYLYRDADYSHLWLDENGTICHSELEDGEENLKRQGYILCTTLTYQEFVA